MTATAPAPLRVPPAATAVRATSSSAMLVTLLSGCATTLLALVGVWAVSRYWGENVMGWYANYVLPIGALLVGLVASSGFALGSYLSGARVTGRLLALVLLVLLGGYVLAQYLDFRLAFPEGATMPDGAEAGFLDHYDFVTRSFAWKERNDQMGSPLGNWGYLLRLGEVIGFTVGGMLVPLALRKVPYCAACARYMRQPSVAAIPAGKGTAKAKEVAALEADRTARAQAEAGAARLVAAGRTGDAAGFAVAVAEVGRSKARPGSRKGVWVHLRVVHCPGCGAGELRTALAFRKGKQVKVTPLSVEGLERGVAPRLLAALRGPGR